MRFLVDECTGPADSTVNLSVRPNDKMTVRKKIALNAAEISQAEVWATMESHRLSRTNS